MAPHSRAFVLILLVLAQRSERALVLNRRMRISRAPTTILFGTETGDCLVLAEFAGQIAGRLGLPFRIADSATYDMSALTSEQTIIFIVSTHEGLPPRSAIEFFELLEEGELPLNSLYYAVLAVGDSSYDDFCAAGLRADKALEGRGASRLATCCQIDAHERSLGREWIEGVLAGLSQSRASAVRNEDAPPASPS
jgi:sulfite reductase (NADPH) flavoprotein alpha-component